MSDDEIIAVVQAHKEGKKIQFSDNDGSWFDCAAGQPVWNFGKRNYRVASEPRKPREWTIPIHFLRGSNEIYDSEKVEMVHVREVIE